MKKIGLLVLLSAGSILVAKTYSYQDLRSDILEHTFLNQKGFMPQELYRTLLGCYIDEMERDTKTMDYFKRESNPALAFRFKHLFADYNFFWLRNYANPHSGYQKLIKECECELLPDLLSEIAADSEDENFDVEKELAVIKAIVERACEEYYKNLNWKKKFILSYV